MPDNISELGEHGLIERIRSRVPSAPKNVILGIGDDAAVLAALNIADEYFRCRDGQTTDDEVVKQRVLELVEKLDTAIADAKNSSSD